MTLRRTLLLSAAVAVLAPAATASAQLTLVGPADAHGTGFGAVQTVLTLHSNSGAEVGCIGPSGVHTCVAGDLVSGTSHSHLYTIGDFSGVTGENFRLFLNFTEPQAANKAGGTLNNATLTVYNGNTSVFSASTGAYNWSNTVPGIGKPDFVFGLTPSSAALFDNVLHQPGAAGYTIGLYASFADVQGGPETFYLGFAPPAPKPPVPGTVPEPSSLVLLGSGLIGIAPLARRRRRGSHR